MAVLVFAESEQGGIKKSSLEAVTYGKTLADQLGDTCYAVTVGDLDQAVLEDLGQYGASKVYDARLETETIRALTTAISTVAEKTGADHFILAKSSVTDAFSGRLAIRTGAGIVSNVTELPDMSDGFKVKKSIYTGKAFANVSLQADKKMLLIKKNAVQLNPGNEKAEVEKADIQPPEKDFAVKRRDTVKAGGDILLTEAEVIVSGGRGMKGPENWNLIEDLAKALGAATACSKPVADNEWRPHHEHVGQTGVKVSPKIYIACGISGAIQHLAGVNASQVIVVINKDEEAPFFKAADYGIVGDVFDVLPKLTGAAKKLN